MRQIDGFFAYGPLPEIENHHLENLCPPGGSLCFFVSGRCANYYALQNTCLTNTKKAAYVPVYTCETAPAPLLKAGYEFLFYDVPKGLTSIFDEGALDHISVVNLCGYYGSCSYDRKFIRRRSEWGIIIMEDTTHSFFSFDGVDPHCDYTVGGIQKWIGVPAGGSAIKRKDSFSLPVPPPDETYPSMHSISMRGEQQLFQLGIPDLQVIQKFNDTFRDAEMMLCRIFDPYGSDQDSGYTIRYYDLEQSKQRRHANYQHLLDHMPEHPQLIVIFPVLKKGAVPSHSTAYVEDRDMVQSYLAGRGIKTTIYQSQGSVVNTEGYGDVAYTYGHVLPFTCNQRYETEDMKYICRQIEGMSEK